MTDTIAFSVQVPSFAVPQASRAYIRISIERGFVDLRAHLADMSASSISHRKSSRLETPLS